MWLFGGKRRKREKVRGSAERNSRAFFSRARENATRREKQIQKNKKTHLSRIGQRAKEPWGPQPSGGQVPERVPEGGRHGAVGVGEGVLCVCFDWRS